MRAQSSGDRRGSRRALWISLFCTLASVAMLGAVAVESLGTGGGTGHADTGLRGVPEPSGYNHLIPRDLAARIPVEIVDVDILRDIPGDETRQTLYDIHLHLTVGTMAYGGSVYGYHLVTQDRAFNIIDTDNDGVFEALYEHGEEVTLPMWLVEAH